MQTSILCRAPWTWAPLRRAFAQVLFLSPSLSPSLFLSHTTHTQARILSLSLSRSLFLPFSPSMCVSLSLALALTHRRALSLARSLFFALYVSISLFLSVTHTRKARHKPSTPIVLSRLRGTLGFFYMVESFPEWCVKTCSLQGSRVDCVKQVDFR